jgi:hypothetical protein
VHNHATCNVLSDPEHSMNKWELSLKEMALYVYTCKLILKAFKGRIVLIFKIPPNFTYCEHKK